MSLNLYRDKIEDALGNVAKSGKPDTLYAPVRYILDLGGKRVRPAMLLLSYHLFKDKIDQALPAAVAIEVFHNFSLIHDDILDESMIRRGKPSVHARFGENTAILSGDTMLVMAYQCLEGLEERYFMPAMKTFTQTAIEVCEGQQMDMDFEERDDVEANEYLLMIEKKTAVLLAAAMKIGGIIADARGEDCDRLYEIGRSIGIAFQLKDDYLDTFGQGEAVGKRIGGDLLNNKKTILSIETRNRLSQRSESFKLYSEDQSAETYVRETISLMRSLGIHEYCESLIDEHTRTAYRLLDEIKGRNEVKVELYSLIDQLKSRES